MSAVDEATAQRLATAIRARTVSYQDPAQIDQQAFDELAAHIEASFPRVHEHLILRTFGNSRLYEWPGTDPTRSVLLLAHMDVVPVDDTKGWTHPAFDGVVDDEFIWGRGAIDDKSRVFALLEAAEAELAAGFTPAVTVYLGFGHDEEIDGVNGATAIARYLSEAGVRAEFLLDEGGVIAEGAVAGIDKPVASIMLGEKGHITVKLSVNAAGGHSSLPPKQTAVGRLARAVARLQDNPVPTRAIPVVLDMAARLAPHANRLHRIGLSLATRAPDLFARFLAREPVTESLVRTTTAPTVFHGGVKANVLPQHAYALVNFRILPGETTEDVFAHCRKVIDDDEVIIEEGPGFAADPSPISPTDTPAFALLSELIRQACPEAAVTTGLVPGATDARHYHGVAATRYNFAPIILDSSDFQRIHGTDERISRANYARLIDFNRALLHRI